MPEAEDGLRVDRGLQDTEGLEAQPVGELHQTTCFLTVEFFSALKQQYLSEPTTHVGSSVQNVEVL